MSASTVDRLLDERARLVALNAGTSSHLWAAEFLLKRVEKLLAEAILPTPALAAHRDVLCQEITELLSEDREHPASEVVADDTWPPDSVLPGEAVSPDGSSRGTGQDGNLAGGRHLPRSTSGEDDAA